MGRRKNRYTPGKRVVVKKRRRKILLPKWTLLVVLGLAAVSCVAAAYVVVMNSSYFQVDDIVVRGNDRVDSAELTAHLSDTYGKNLLSLSMAEVAERAESHPWVAKATASRDFPRQIELHVVEQQPVMILADAGQYWLVNADGEPFLEVKDIASHDLPVVEIAPIYSGAVDNTLSIVDALALLRAYNSTTTSLPPVARVHFWGEGVSLHTRHPSVALHFSQKLKANWLMETLVHADNAYREDSAESITDIYVLEAGGKPSRVMVSHAPKLETEEKSDSHG